MPTWSDSHHGMAQTDTYNRTTKLTKPGQRTAHASLAKDSTLIYYPPDGTGRDTYVIKGNGGTCKEYRGNP